MKRAIIILFLINLVLLVSCTKDSKTQRDESVVIPTVADNAVQTTSDYSSLKVKYITIKDIEKQYEVEQRDVSIVNEFLQFLKSQTYLKSQEETKEDYYVKLMGEDGNPILEISFGARSVALDRKFDFGGTVVEKGTYEVEVWISEYLKSFYMGQVLNPSIITLPARLKINGDVMEGELVDKNDTKINHYDVIPKLNDFINDSILGQNYEIIDYKVIYGFEAMEAEVKLIKAQNRCISVIFSTSENFLDINSDNNFQSFAEAGGLIISSQKDKPYVYKIKTDSMIFNVKVSEEFHKQFNELFLLNTSTPHQLTSDEIMALSSARKQNFMEFVSKNLGLDSVTLRDDYTFEAKQLKLGNGGLYKILSFSDSYITRLLIFKNNDKKLSGYIGNIDIRSRGDKANYKIKRIANKTFIIAEKNCCGHGTGYLSYFQDWYTIDGDAVKNVLSIPSIHNDVNSYGFTIELNSLTQDSTKVRLSADYKLSKVYSLELPIADESEYVTVTADKQVTFVWDESQGHFVSKYDFHNEGIAEIFADSQEIKDKCSEILDKYYIELDSNITDISSKTDEEKRWLVRSYKAFLEDCNPSERVDILKRKLMNIYSE